jgi:uncharacterized protein (TIGR02147 family)
MSAHLKVNSTLLSMVLAGDRDLSYEQAFDLASYLELTELEREFFLLLVQHERAGNVRLKTHLKERLEKVRGEANKMVNRIAHEKQLDEKVRATYYSSWIFAAIRIYCSTREKGRTVAEICERFQLPRTRAVEVLSFLKDNGLVTEDGDRYQMATSLIFLEQGSPHLPRHHANWRMKALQKADHLPAKELMFTFPLSISKADFEKVREELATAIAKISEIVKESPAEDVACMNVDFFWLEN